MCYCIMRKFITFVFCLVCFNLSAQVWVGQYSTLDVRGFAFGGVIKGNINSFTSSLGASYNIHNHWVNPLVTVGYNIIDLEHHKIGVNILFDRYLTMPGLTYMEKVNDLFYFDCSIRPSFRSFIQADFTIALKLHEF